MAVRLVWARPNSRGLKLHVDTIPRSTVWGMDLPNGVGPVRGPGLGIGCTV